MEILPYSDGSTSPVEFHTEAAAAWKTSRTYPVSNMPLPNQPPPSAWMASTISMRRFSQISAALCMMWARLENGSFDHSGKAACAASMAAAVSARPESGTSAQTEPSAGL